MFVILVQRVRYGLHSSGGGHGPGSSHQADEFGPTAQEGTHHQRDPRHEGDQAS